MAVIGGGRWDGLRVGWSKGGTFPGIYKVEPIRAPDHDWSHRATAHFARHFLKFVIASFIFLFISG